YKTFILPRKEMDVATQIFTEIRQKGIDVYDAMHILNLIVTMGCQSGMFPLWEQLKRKRGIFFYTVEANSEPELNEKVKQLDEIILSKKCEELGPEISDGNYAKWHYAEQGHWQLYHNLWGYSPALEPLTAECFTSIKNYPKILSDIEKWDMEHNEDMQKILNVTGQRPISGSGPILLIDGNNVELTCGLTSFGNYFDGEIHEEFEEINLRLWRTLLERVIKQGAQFYMMGDFNSRVMVEMGAYPNEFYNLMKSIKKTLDPKCILSRGKYNFWGGD
ncbi:MAG: hypothetical protein ACFFCI_23640, partial [Promethearchaeota archaeon]